MRVTTIAIISFILLSCSEETSFVLEEEVDAAFIPFFDRFQTEASMRGIEVDWAVEKINASLVSIEDVVVGQCLTYANDNREINIDREYWNKSTEVDKEYLIFHELGHCILRRSHLEDSRSDGTCLSMMNSGEGMCIKNYNAKTRQEYLDELFS